MTLLIELLVGALSFVFGLLFRFDNPETEDERRRPDGSLRPENPADVFLYSILGTLVLASAAAGVTYYVFETTSAAWTGFGVVGFLGVCASMSASVG